jgi:23S rRNA (cytidine1920-2'-O)/16S rRNA (cytidine1409-2'-O)-methyltransferase
MAARKRADQLLFEQHGAGSREQAKRLIMAGQVSVLAEGREMLVDKPGMQLPEDARLAVRQGERYVSRGGLKLETALEHFRLDVSGLVCLDAGASTGGFTDCLLQHGAARVYAVDVGRGQLDWRLRNDPRVVSMEKVNLREAGPDLLPEQVDLVTADVSFISLTMVLPACVALLRPGGRVVALVKPQFELGKGRTHKGVVRSEADRQEAVDKVVGFCARELGLDHEGTVPAKITGPSGNQEYLALFRKPQAGCGAQADLPPGVVPFCG